MVTKSVLEPCGMLQAINLIKIGKATFAKDMDGNNEIKKDVHGNVIVEPLVSDHFQKPAQVDGECWQCYVEIFTRHDLEPWDIVQQRNGMVFIVDSEYNLLSLTGCVDMSKYYEDDLRRKGGLKEKYAKFADEMRIRHNGK